MPFLDLFKKAAAPSLTAKLAAAINENDEEQVAALLAQGANPDEPDAPHNWTGLQRAAANGRSGILALLLAHGANQEVKSNIGHSLLHLAANGMHPAVFGQLTQAGLPVDNLDELGQTPLFLAAGLDDAEGVRRLLALGANPRIVSRTGQTALAAAEARENDPVMPWSTANARQVLEAALASK